MFVRLGSVCTKIGSGITPRGGSSVYKTEGVALIRSQNVLDFSFSSNGLVFISEDIAENMKSVEVVPGDVLLNITGDSVARSCLAPKDKLPARVNQHVMIIRADKTKLNPMYLLLVLQHRKDWLLSQSEVGATRKALTKSLVESLEIDLPDIEHQNKISSIFQNIQQLIRTNERINDYLLKLLETLYLRIRTDYSTDYTLSDICIINTERYYMDELSVENYYSTENMLPEKSGVVTASTLPSDQKVIACQVGDVLVSNIRPYFKKIHYCDKNSGCSSDVICFRAKKIEDSHFLYSVLYDDRFFEYVVAGSKGTKMPRGDKQQIMMYPIPVVPKDVLKQFNKIGRCVLSIVSTNNTINRYLMKTREIILTELFAK